MISINFVGPDGKSRKVNVPEGISVMQAAVNNDIQEIVGDCGGGLSCATCHVYVGADWKERLPAPSADEVEMLEATSEEPTEFSRLSCQIRCDASIDGLTLYLPKCQR